MIGVKLIGAACIAAAGVLVALGAVRRERKKLVLLEAWIDLVSFLKSEIDLYLTPLDTLLANADPSLLRQFGVPEGQAITLDALADASEPFLDAEARRTIHALLRELGASYREEQIKQCEMRLEALERLREEAALSVPQKTRLYLTLCLCAVAGVLILLW